MSWRDHPGALQWLLVGAALAVAAGIATVLVLSRETPPRETAPLVVPNVEVIRAERKDVQVEVVGYGTVRATVQAQVVPQVSGRVVSVHPQLFNGGFIPAGEVLLAIDPADYQLAVEEAASQLEQARAGLAAVEARLAEAATSLENEARDLRRMRELLERGVVSKHDADQAETAWRIAEARLEREQAERQTARARLEGAQVALRKAQLNLERSHITLPFDAVVLQERVDAGQFVLAGQSVAEVYGASALEIPVPLEDHHLEWLPTVPVAGRPVRPGSGSSPPRAEVRAQFAGGLATWTGEVVRTEGQVDPKSRMVNLVVRVEGVHSPSGGSVPLLPGTFVEVRIFGRTLEEVVPVPRYAVHNRDEVWVVREDRLRVQKVRVLRRERDWVYVSDGVEEGEPIITTAMDVITDGMKVQVAREHNGLPFSGNGEEAKLPAAPAGGGE